MRSSAVRLAGSTIEGSANRLNRLDSNNLKGSPWRQTTWNNSARNAYQGAHRFVMRKRRPGSDLPRERQYRPLGKSLRKKGHKSHRDGSGRHGDGQISLCVLMWDTVGGGGSAQHAIGAMLTVGQNRQLRLVLQPIRPAQSAEAAGSTKNRSGTGESYFRNAFAKALGEYDDKSALAQHKVGPSNHHNKRETKLNESCTRRKRQRPAHFAIRKM